MRINLKNAQDVSTAPLVAVGLVGGWIIARESGVRPVGGLVLAGAGGLAGRTWLVRNGPGVAGLLGGVYLAAFGAAHPLARRIGAWPSVLTVTTAAATAAHLLSDRA